MRAGLLPKEGIRPKSGGIKSPLGCLTQARYGIAWGVLGAAMGCFDEARRYAANRIMFGKPIAQTQIQQERLHCRQMLCRFLEEHLVELTHVDSHATPSPRSTAHRPPEIECTPACPLA